MTSRVESLHTLRLERRALRAERDRVRWWRRVVRARLDLAVASAAPPGPLGEDVAFVLPLDVCLQVPRADDLRAALPVGAGHEVGLLPDLRALDARLETYGRGVDQALAAATARLVERLASDPGAALRARAAAVDGP